VQNGIRAKLHGAVVDIGSRAIHLARKGWIRPLVQLRKAHKHAPLDAALRTPMKDETTLDKDLNDSGCSDEAICASNKNFGSFLDY